MAKRRYVNVKTATLGALPVTTIQSVNYTDTTQEIAASGDDDSADSFLAKGKREVRGTLAIQDPVQAEALMAAAQADFVFKGVPETGGVGVTVTLKNAIFFTNAANAPHNAIWNQSLTFRCYDPLGVDPVTVALDA